MAWLELTAFPTTLFVGLPFSGQTERMLQLVGELPYQMQLGVYATLVSLSLKLLLLANQLRIGCAPAAETSLPAGQQGYDFDAAKDAQLGSADRYDGAPPADA